MEALEIALSALFGYCYSLTLHLNTGARAPRWAFHLMLTNPLLSAGNHRGSNPSSQVGCGPHLPPAGSGPPPPSPLYLGSFLPGPFPLPWEMRTNGLKSLPPPGTRWGSCSKSEWVQSPAPSPPNSTPPSVLWKVTNSPRPAQFLQQGGAYNFLHATLQVIIGRYRAVIR